MPRARVERCDVASVGADEETPSGESERALDRAVQRCDPACPAGARDGTLRIWRSETPVLVRGPRPIAQVAAARTRILTRLADGSVRIYGFDGRLLHAFDAHAQRASLAPDGTVFATAHGRDAALWDVATGKLRRKLTGHRSLVTDVEFSPDSSLLITASDDHDSRIWDV